MLKVSLLLIASLFCSTAMADNIRYTYVQGGLYFANDTEQESYGGYTDKYKTTSTGGWVRGSVGFGSHFYLPASIEYTITDYDATFCSSWGCESYESSANEFIGMVGAGVHFDLGSHVSIYGDISLVQSYFTYDNDGGYDDSDEDDNDSSDQKRIGIRIQPLDLIELDFNVARRGYFDSTLKHRSVGLQFNITPAVGIGAELRKEEAENSNYKENYLGAYFRYSFK